jgi:hypothetical protein
MILILIIGKTPLTIEKNWLSNLVEKSERNWVRKISSVMKDIILPKVGMPDDFVDLHDIVESHTKKDSLWAKELSKVTNTTPGQVQQFMEHSIRARVVLQQLSTSLVKY